MSNASTAAAIGDKDRLAALAETGLLDGPAEEAFDRLTRLVCRLLGVPVALVSLVDADRQFFKSAYGLPEPWASRRETPLSHSFCQHVVASGAPLIVQDARRHGLVCDNLAVPDLGVMAYLGMPLTTRDGHVIGSLCAIDTEPRVWTDADAAVLQDLAMMTISEITLGRMHRTVQGRLQDAAAVRGQLDAVRRAGALGQLANGIVHDFNNILQAVQSGVQLAQQRLDSDLSAARNLLDMVGDVVARGAALTRRLQAFVPHDTLAPEPVDCAALLEDLREILTHTLGRSIAVQVARPAGPLIAMAVRGQLQAVLTHLAANARDAMPQGGTLTFSAAAEQVPETVAQAAGIAPGTYVRLSVSDTGTGMDAETLARATEPFFTTRPDGHGAGLGLTLARDFAEQSGGELAIRSEPERGTEVTIRLPLATDGQA